MDGDDAPSSPSHEKRLHKITKEMISSPILARPLDKPPPRLDVLSDLGQCELHRSSTFRTNLEKAVDDINTKYDTVSATQRSKSETLENGCVSKSIYPYPTTDHTGSCFQPRYRLPTFVHVSLIRAQPKVGELEEVSSTSPGQPELAAQPQSRDDSRFAKRQGTNSLERNDFSKSTEITTSGRIQCGRQDQGGRKFRTVACRPRLAPTSILNDSEDSRVGRRHQSAGSTVSDRYLSKRAPLCGLDTPSLAIDVDALPKSSPRSSVTRASSLAAHSDHPGVSDAQPRLEKRLPLPYSGMPFLSSNLSQDSPQNSPQQSGTCPEVNPVLHEADGSRASSFEEGQATLSVSRLVSKFRRVASPPSGIRRPTESREQDIQASGVVTAVSYDSRPIQFNRRCLSTDIEDDSALLSTSDGADTTIHHSLANKRRVSSTDDSGSRAC